MIGAAVGGFAGGLEHGLSGALIGAALGTGVTSISHKEKIKENRKREIVGCMKAKGHQLTGI